MVPNNDDFAPSGSRKAVGVSSEEYGSKCLLAPASCALGQLGTRGRPAVRSWPALHDFREGNAECAFGAIAIADGGGDCCEIVVSPLAATRKRSAVASS